MTTPELIQKINYLARKERYEGLTPEEKEQQQILRRQYLNHIRGQVIQTLEEAGYSKKDDHTKHQKKDTLCGCHHCRNKHEHKH